MDFSERLDLFRATLPDEYVPRLAADRFVKQMWANHPEELKAWLTEHATRFVTASLSDAERRYRKRMLEAPDSTGLFEVTFVVDKTQTRKKLGELYADNLEYSAAQYESSGKHDLAMAAFLRAVARRVGDSRVGEVLDEDEVHELMVQLVPARRLLLA